MGHPRNLQGSFNGIQGIYIFIYYIFNSIDSFQVLQIMEVWHYEKTEKYDKDCNPDGGLFSQYVNCFMKLKLVGFQLLKYSLRLINYFIGSRRMALMGDVR